MTAADGLTTWRDELPEARASNGDDTPIVATAGHFDEAFDPGFGTSNGPPVLIWTEAYVYFPVTYDGLEGLGCAPRDPRPQPQAHLGGE